VTYSKVLSSVLFRKWENKVKVNIKSAGREDVDLIQFLRIEFISRIFEHGNEPPSSIKYGEFLDQLSNNRLLNAYPKPWSYIHRRRNTMKIFTLDSR